MHPELARKVLLLIYTQYAGRLPTHVLLQIKTALWPDGNGPTVHEAAHAEPPAETV